MNVPYLLKTLNTTKLAELVAHMDLPPLDVNIALWESIENGEIEMDEKEGKVRLLIDVETPVNMTQEELELREKIMKVVRHYHNQELLVTRGRLVSYMKEPSTGIGYKMHSYLMALQSLIDDGEIVEHVVSVPEVKKKRPFNRFVFLPLPNNPNTEEWAAKAVNKWIAQFEKKK